MISFWVPGHPQTAGSKRGFVRGGHVNVVDANEKTKPWQAQVALFAQQAYRGPLLDVPLDVSFVFCRLRPKGHYGKRKGEVYLKPNQLIAPAVIPDALKWARAVEDALTKVIWTDDARITIEHIWKVYATCEGVAVKIEPQVSKECPQWACDLMPGEPT